MTGQSQHCSHFTNVDSLQEGYKCPLPFTKRTGPEDLYPVCSLLDTHNSAFKLQMIDSISFVFNKWLEMVCRAVLSPIWLLDPRAARQAPLSLGFPRQEYWSGLPFPSPGDLPHPGIKPVSPALQVDFLPCEPPGKPINCLLKNNSLKSKTFRYYCC